MISSFLRQVTQYLLYSIRLDWQSQSHDNRNIHIFIQYYHFCQRLFLIRTDIQAPSMILKDKGLDIFVWEIIAIQNEYQYIKSIISEQNITYHVILQDYWD
ncbi:hypothetical protein pb186bvf_003883 [Paramecium bursaria]